MPTESEIQAAVRAIIADGGNPVVELYEHSRYSRDEMEAFARKVLEAAEEARWAEENGPLTDAALRTMSEDSNPIVRDFAKYELAQRERNPSA